MRRLYMAVRRLWLFATCTHRNTCNSIEFADSTELRFCRACGRVLSCMTEGDRRHNRHLNYPLLDYTSWCRVSAIQSLVVILARG